MVFRAVNAAEREAAFDDEEFDALVATALALVADDRASEAVPVFELIERARPHAYFYRAAYANALWIGRRDRAGAQQQVERCIELSPSNIDCVRLRAVYRAEAGDVGGACDDLRTVLAVRTDDMDATELLARLLLEDGQHEDAAAVILPALEVAPHRVSLLLMYGRMLEGAARVAEARAVFEQIRSLHRDSVQGATYLMHFLQRNGFPREAGQVRREIERELQRRQAPPRQMRPL